MARRVRQKENKPLKIRVLEAKKNRSPEEEHAVLMWNETRRARNFTIDFVRSKGMSIENLSWLLHEFRDKIAVSIPTDIQCKIGCGYCCHIRVTTSIPEAILVYNTIRNNQELISKINKNYKNLNTIDRDMWIREQLECPFLYDDKCSIYTIRPGACRACISYDVDNCRDGYESKDPEYQTATRTPHGIISLIPSIAMIEACDILGLHSYEVELVSSLRILSATENSCEEWINGRDLFANARG